MITGSDDSVRLVCHHDHQDVDIDLVVSAINQWARNDQGMVGSDSIVAGASLMSIGWFAGTAKWPSDLQRLLPLPSLIQPYRRTLPHSHHDHQNQWQNTGCPVAFTNQVLATLAACDPNRQHTLDPFHLPTQPVFVAGFPSESELNADRRLRSLITKLSGQGYRPSQIERFHFQSAQNGLSVKISDEPN